MSFQEYAYFGIKPSNKPLGYEKLNKSSLSKREEPLQQSLGREMHRIFADHAIAIVLVLWTPHNLEVFLAYLHCFVSGLYIFFASKDAFALKRLSYIALCIINLSLMFKGVLDLL